MAEITAGLVKQLREEMGAGMMDCKKALTETKGDLEEAKDWLRKKGLATAAKKAGRTAAEGLVAIAVDGNKGALVEVNSETDFVARNDKFQALTKAVAQLALQSGGDIEKLKNASYPGTGRIVEAEIVELVTVIGENISLRRTEYVEAKEGIVASYVHNEVASGMGKIAVLVALESTGDKAKLAAIGKQVAMHIAAAKPDALTPAGVDSAKLERERVVYAEQAKASGKPESIIEKMVEGRVRKYYEEVVLLEQIFVIDGKMKVSEALKAAEKDVGAPIAVSDFAYFVLGSGIEKESTDFAAEVAAVAGVK